MKGAEYVCSLYSVSDEWIKPYEGCQMNNNCWQVNNDDLVECWIENVLCYLKRAKFYPVKIMYKRKLSEIRMGLACVLQVSCQAVAGTILSYKYQEIPVSDMPDFPDTLQVPVQYLSGTVRYRN